MEDTRTCEVRAILTGSTGIVSGSR